MKLMLYLKLILRLRSSFVSAHPSSPLILRLRSSFVSAQDEEDGIAQGEGYGIGRDDIP